MIAAVAETVYSMYTLDIDLPSLLTGGLWLDFSGDLPASVAYPYAVFAVDDRADDTQTTNLSVANVTFQVFLKRETGYNAVVTLMRRFRTVYHRVTPGTVTGYRFHKMRRIGGSTLSPDIDMIGFEDRYTLRVEET